MCIIFTSLCKNQVSLTKFLQSEVKIIHIIVQNNTWIRSRFHKFLNKNIFLKFKKKGNEITDCLFYIFDKIYLITKFLN